MKYLIYLVPAEAVPRAVEIHITYNSAFIAEFDPESGVGEIVKSRYGAQEKLFGNPLGVTARITDELRLALHRGDVPLPPSEAQPPA